jgi:hypothetical protein
LPVAAADEFFHASGASVFLKLALQFEPRSAETSLPTGGPIARPWDGDEGESSK